MSYDITLIKDTVRQTDAKVDRIILELKELREKLNAISLTLAHLKERKK